MPPSPQHTRKRRKNLALFAALVALVAVLYAITLLKMGA